MPLESFDLGAIAMDCERGTMNIQRTPRCREETAKCCPAINAPPYSRQMTISMLSPKHNQPTALGIRTEAALTSSPRPPTRHSHRSPPLSPPSHSPKTRSIPRPPRADTGRTAAPTRIRSAPPTPPPSRGSGPRRCSGGCSARSSSARSTGGAAAALLVKLVNSLAVVDSLRDSSLDLFRSSKDEFEAIDGDALSCLFPLVIAEDISRSPDERSTEIFFQPFVALEAERNM